ncbi:hypothetical protein [Streptomyces sp. NPDC051738]|uniref:hypothetical protein n=1 Tax=Streptomyces sp. NPDC051738 TaxID=3365672 RepID=UPI0037D4A2B9
MQKKTVIIVGVCVGLCAGAWAITPVLKQHNESFPDAFNDHFLKERVKTFATTRDAPQVGDGEGMFVLPDWVPEDATDIKVKIQTDGNAELIRFTLADGRPKLDNGKGCSSGGVFGDSPSLVADWWGQGIGEGDGRPDCSGQYQFRVVVKDGKAYAWSNGDLVEG